MTERLHFHFSLSCIGEGNGNPLQCSCLENPRDRGARGLPSMGWHRVGHDWSDLATVKDGHGMGEGEGVKNWESSTETLLPLFSWVSFFVTPWTAARQASLSFTISQSLCKLMSTESVMCHPTISSSVIPFSSCPQSFPASGSFPLSWLFTSNGQSIGASASASVLPMNIQG